MAGKVRNDSLFVGLTRPPLLFGVSYTFALLNGFACLMLYVMTSEFKYLVVMFPIHFLGYYLCSKEPLFIELFMIKSSKFSRCRNRFYHGADSYDPY